jgi:stage III sporulation protein AB
MKTFRFLAILALCASVLSGLRISYTLNERKRILGEILYFLQAIESKLRCMCMPLDCCFYESGGIFYDAAIYMKGGLSPSEAVRRAAEDAPHLKKEDKELLFGFSKGLCADDLEGQIANVKLLSKGITVRLSEAEAEAKQRGKLAINGCTLLGAAAVILMI